jgi:ABC-type branched-subunit amino acid transport system substrate-binding protein
MTGANRRAVLALAGVVLLAGCKVVPKGPPGTTPPPKEEPSTLPSDGRHRVALLVPLSGANAALGQSLENATQMALLDTNAQGLRITTYDTAAGAGIAAARAEADGNRLVVGPLAADEIAAVSRATRAPSLSFAAEPDVAARDAFLLGTSVEQSVARSVTFARGRGLARFGALIPAGQYGTRAGQALALAVRAAGGTLVGSETYERSNPSIVSAARRLKARGGLDAVLIADTPRYAVLAAPTLKAGSAGLRLIGTELWAGDASVARSAALRGSWFAAVSDARFGQFSTSYKARFGRAPYRAATMGYDAVLLAIRVARDWKPGTAFPTGRLADEGGFVGLDGAFRFRGDGRIERALEVREARAGTIAVVGPAPAKFGG